MADEAPQEPAERALSPAEAMRQALRRATDIVERVVDVPEWASIGAGKILLRSPSAWSRFEWIAWYQQHQTDDHGPDGGAYDLAVRNIASLVMCAHHPDTREKLFTPEDIGWLLEHHENVIMRLVSESVDVMGVSPEAIELGKGGS